MPGKCDIHLLQEPTIITLAVKQLSLANEPRGRCLSKDRRKCSDRGDQNMRLLDMTGAHQSRVLSSRWGLQWLLEDGCWIGTAGQQRLQLIFDLKVLVQTSETWGVQSLQISVQTTELFYSRLVADRLFVLDEWVCLSATGLCFSTLFLLGYIWPTPVVSFRFSFPRLDMLRI